MTRLVEQNFEGTGFDNGETWLAGLNGTPSTGVVDPDYATGPLRGSQSLRMKDDENYGGFAITKFSDDTGVTGVYGFFRLKIIDRPSTTREIMQLYNAQGPLEEPTAVETHEMIWIGSDGVLHMWPAYNEGEEVAGSTALTNGTVYYVWWHVTRTTLTDGSGWIKLSTTPTLPGSNEISWSNVDLPSASYINVNTLGFTTLHASSYEYIVDQVILDTAAIGSMSVPPSQMQFRFFGTGDELPHKDVAWSQVGTAVTGYVGTGTGTESKNLPSGLQQNDIVIFAGASDSSMNSDGVATGQGWSDIYRDTNTSPGFQVCYKVMGETPDSTVTLNQNGTSRQAFVIQAWRGVDTSNVLDVAAVTLATDTSGDPDSPEITPATVGALIFAVGGVDDDDGTVSTWPSGYSNGVESNTGQSSTSAGATIALCSKQWSSGADNPAAFAISSDDAWRAGTFALRPSFVADGRTPSHAAGTDPTLNVDTDYGVSVRVESATSDSPDEDGYKWQYKLNSGSWTDITDSSSVVKASATADFANGDDVAQYIGGSGTYISDNHAALDTTGTLTLAAVMGASSAFESHLNFQIVSGDVVNGDIIYLRIVEEDGTALDSYGTADTNIPAITVSEGAASSLSVKHPFSRPFSGPFRGF